MKRTGNGLARQSIARFVGAKWTRTTLWRLRSLWGDRLTREPILIALPRGVAVEKAGWMRLWSLPGGVEVAIVGRRVLWRRVPAVPKTRNAFEAARAAWETRHDGFRVWLSEPEQRVQFDAQQLETVLVRALVQELMGKRRPKRSRDP